MDKLKKYSKSQLIIIELCTRQKNQIKSNCVLKHLNKSSGRDAFICGE